LTKWWCYSNDLQEVILGKAIKQLDLSLEEIVVITMECTISARGQGPRTSESGAPTTTIQLYLVQVVSRSPGENLLDYDGNLDNLGYVNQYGLSRKHIFDSVQDSLKRLQPDYVDTVKCSYTL
jgi:aryl-alcohol dehydrogenase-like predicted oxidoreductase